MAADRRRRGIPARAGAERGQPGLVSAARRRHAPAGDVGLRAVVLGAAGNGVLQARPLSAGATVAARGVLRAARVPDDARPLGRNASRAADEAGRRGSVIAVAGGGGKPLRGIGRPQPAGWQDATPAYTAGIPDLARGMTSTARAAVEVSAIRKAYGRTVAVDSVSFDVREGEIFGLIGPNGAGKTTTMECVEGVRRADGGRVSVLGRDPVRDVYALQERVGVQLQEAQLQKRIKGREAVHLWASLYRRPVDGDRLRAQLWLAGKPAA